MINYITSVCYIHTSPARIKFRRTHKPIKLYCCKRTFLLFGATHAVVRNRSKKACLFSSNDFAPAQPMFSLRTYQSLPNTRSVNQDRRKIYPFKWQINITVWTKTRWEAWMTIIFVYQYRCYSYIRKWHFLIWTQHTGVFWSNTANATSNSCAPS